MPSGVAGIGTGVAVTGRTALPAQPVPPGTPVAEVTVAFGSAMDGSWVYVADEYAKVVYRVDFATATIGTYAGNRAATNLDGTGNGGRATAADVPYPQGLTVDDASNLYILQIEDQVRRADQSGTIGHQHPRQVG